MTKQLIQENIEQIQMLKALHKIRLESMKEIAKAMVRMQERAERFLSND